MAQQYPSRESREGISGKFAELVKARRGKSNAKTQWSINDARTTYAWARKEYGSPSELTPEPEEEGIEDVKTHGMRSGYRQRNPSAKATLSQSKDKGKCRAVLTVADVNVTKKPSTLIELGDSSELSELASAAFSDSD